MEEFLKPTEFLDFDRESVRDFAERNSAGAKSDTEKAVALYYAVRDGFQYNPYIIDLRREGLTASNLLTRERGYCVEKAVLLAASARAVGVPSRLSFYIVRNRDRAIGKGFEEKLSSVSRRGGSFSRRRMVKDDAGVQRRFVQISRRCAVRV